MSGILLKESGVVSKMEDRYLFISEDKKKEHCNQGSVPPQCYKGAPARLTHLFQARRFVFRPRCHCATCQDATNTADHVRRIERTTPTLFEDEIGVTGDGPLAESAGLQ